MIEWIRNNQFTAGAIYGYFFGFCACLFVRWVNSHYWDDPK
jgi:hypothetical protein